MECVELHILYVRIHIELVGLCRAYAELLMECVGLHREVPAPAVPGDSSSLLHPFWLKLNGSQWDIIILET